MRLEPSLERAFETFASPMRAQPAPDAVLAVDAPTGAGEHAFGGGRGRAGGAAAEHPRVGASFKEGLKRHDAGDEEGARLSFLQAFSVLKRPNIIYNLARAEQLTNHPVDAITHYKLFVADNAVTAVDREAARKRIVELSAIVGHVVIEAPSGADLWIDGQMLARKAPLGEPADVAGGMHTVQARLGDQTKTVTVACSPGLTVTAKIEIEGMPGTGVVVVPMPGEGGAAPVVPTPAPPVPPAVSDGPSGAKIGTTIGLGAGALIAIGVGVGMQVAAGGKASDVTSLQGSPSSCLGSASSSMRCTELASAANSQASDENARTGAFVAGGLLAAAAVVTWLVWPNGKAAESGHHLVPLVSPGVAGLGFVTAF